MDGHYSLCVFDGSGGVSIAMALSGVPTVCPWEVEKVNRLDVIKNASVLWRLASLGRVLFLMAPNALQHLDASKKAIAEATELPGR